MSDKGNHLSDEDIQKLIMSPFEKRIDITKKIADYYKSGGFNEEQMVMAAKIFGTLVKDTEVKIRQTLAEAIKDQPDIPKEVILSLANDVHEVSLPVLQFSDVLTDADLIEIVTTSGDVEKQKSISKRDGVSESLSDALIETNNDEVVGTLLENEGAQVSPDGYKQIVENFGEKEKIMGSMIERSTLPVAIVESLANKISETIYTKLQEKHKDAFVRMSDVVEKSKDVATMQVIGLRSTDAEYYQFCQLMEKLKISDDLAPIYALCMGNMNIFEVKMARITQTPVLNIRTLLQDVSNKGFMVLYRRAELPKDLYEATEVLISALRGLYEEHKGKLSGAETAKIISRELTSAIMKRVKNVDDVKNLDYILSLVSHYAVSD
ncbi:MAG: hypothetical protein K0R98_498 [Rickettsiaceae bacterium]|jgi:uncharacterized protein (DUF2336 family)|nr:hypothetical protein [Rickettsiaceae bacterium]